MTTTIRVKIVVGCYYQNMVNYFGLYFQRAYGWETLHQQRPCKSVFRNQIFYNYAIMIQLAEVSDLKSECCGFESHLSHQFTVSSFRSKLDVAA